MAAICARTCARNFISTGGFTQHGLYRRQLIRALCTRSTSNDNAAEFMDEKVQMILKRITGMKFEKIFKPVKQKLSPPKYKLVSEERLQELIEEAKEKAEQKLQMPPVLEERNEIETVLSEDHELEGLDTSNIVFTDITYGVPDRERFVVVREPSGILRNANWNERARMLQIYFPREGRKIEMPKVFQDENIDHVLLEERHEGLLDFCCVQFEPDDPNFIRVHHRTYENLNKTGKFDILRSTRHFGGMAFYFAKRKRIDGLLKDMMQRDLIEDSCDLIKLYHLLNPQCSSAREVKRHHLKGLDVIKTFIEMDAEDGAVLELVIQSYENEKRAEVETSS
ncbi:small ribosomal subunit protein mS22-like [Glandiceps talaboti]